jgi:hypothetical protein
LLATQCPLFDFLKLCPLVPPLPFIDVPENLAHHLHGNLLVLRFHVATFNDRHLQHAPLLVSKVREAYWGYNHWHSAFSPEIGLPRGSLA